MTPNELERVAKILMDEPLGVTEAYILSFIAQYGAYYTTEGLAKVTGINTLRVKSLFQNLRKKDLLISITNFDGRTRYGLTDRGRNLFTKQ